MERVVVPTRSTYFFSHIHFVGVTFSHFRNVQYLYLKNDAPKSYTNPNEKRPLPRF